VTVGQCLHGLQTTKRHVVLGDDHLNGFHVVLVAAVGLFAWVSGVVAGMEQGVEEKPVGLRLHHRIVDVGREVTRGLVLPVVVADPVAVEIHSGDEILVRSNTLVNNGGVVAGQVLVRSPPFISPDEGG